MVMLLVAFYVLSVDTDTHHPCHWFVVAVVQSATKICVQLFVDCSMPIFPGLIFPGVCSNLCPLSQWCHPIISFSVTLLFLLPSIFPSFRVFSNELALPIKRPNIGASASASALPMNIQGWFPLGLTGLISCSPRDSQESFLASQFESINSSMLSLLDLGFYKQNPCFCCQGQESVITGVLWTGGIHPLLCFLGSVVTLPCTEQHPLPVWAARLMTWVTSALIHPSVSSST